MSSFGRGFGGPGSLAVQGLRFDGPAWAPEGAGAPNQPLISEFGGPFRTGATAKVAGALFPTRNREHVSSQTINPAHMLSPSQAGPMDPSIGAKPGEPCDPWPEGAPGKNKIQ